MRITERKLRSIIKNVIKETYSPGEIEDLRGSTVVDQGHPDHRLKNDPHHYAISDYNEDLANQYESFLKLKELYKAECYQGNCSYEDFKKNTNVIDLCDNLNLNCESDDLKNLLDIFISEIQQET